jgi:hypothetical protein
MEYTGRTFFKAAAVNMAQADAPAVLDVSDSIFLGVAAKRHWQFHIEVSDASTGAAATPAAGTLDLTFKTPGANRAVSVFTAIDLTDGDQILVLDKPMLAESITCTPNGLDADKVYSVYAVAS